MRINVENKLPLLDAEIDALLFKSKLVGKLTADYIDHPLFAVFRILGLSEIPYADKLPYTQKLLTVLDKGIIIKQLKIQGQPTQKHRHWRQGAVFLRGS